MPHCARPWNEKHYSFLPDSVKRRDWSCDVLCDTTSPVVAMSIASEVLCLTLSGCIPRQFRDVLKTSEQALFLLSTQVDQETSLGSFADSYVATMKIIICRWSSDFEINILSLNDFVDISNAYSTDQWSMQIFYRRSLTSFSLSLVLVKDIHPQLLSFGSD